MIGSSMQVGTRGSDQKRSINQRVAVLGAGPHGQSIARILDPHPQDIDAEWILYDDNPAFNLEPIDWGATAWRWVIGAAWPWVRREIYEKVHQLPGAKMSFRMGNIVQNGAQLSYDVTWGHHVHVCHNAVVSHGCHLGDFVTIAPGAILCGDVKVEQDALIGAGAIILHTGITIGAGAKIGAGAVVTRNVREGATVVGSPARMIDE